MASYVTTHLRRDSIVCHGTDAIARHKHIPGGCVSAPDIRATVSCCNILVVGLPWTPCLPALHSMDLTIHFALTVHMASLDQIMSERLTLINHFLELSVLQSEDSWSLHCQGFISPLSSSSSSSSSSSPSSSSFRDYSPLPTFPLVRELELQTAKCT